MCGDGGSGRSIGGGYCGGRSWPCAARARVRARHPPHLDGSHVDDVEALKEHLERVVGKQGLVPVIHQLRRWGGGVPGWWGAERAPPPPDVVIPRAAESVVSLTPSGKVFLGAKAAARPRRLPRKAGLTFLIISLPPMRSMRGASLETCVCVCVRAEQGGREEDGPLSRHAHTCTHVPVTPSATTPPPDAWLRRKRWRRQRHAERCLAYFGPTAARRRHTRGARRGWPAEVKCSTKRALSRSVRRPSPCSTPLPSRGPLAPWRRPCCFHAPPSTPRWTPPPGGPPCRRQEKVPHLLLRRIVPSPRPERVTPGG